MVDGERDQLEAQNADDDEDQDNTVYCGGWFIDDTEDPVHTIAPEENVYSFFVFVTPVEGKKEQKGSGRGLTIDMMMSWVLVMMNLFMQGVLLYAIWDAVVVDNIDWQASIMNKDPGGDSGLNAVGLAAQGDQCNDGGSLCQYIKGEYTCAPPSVQLSGRWEELDTDGDGVWTKEEVMQARKKLQCKYIVDPVEVFNVFVRFLKKREGLIWISPDLRDGLKIDKAYFDYAAGDINMCGYRNTEMCANVLKKGAFDAPLKHNTAPRVGNTISSALDYCYDLLSPGGTCEMFLPSTYKVWKVGSVKQCGEAKYKKFIYKHPASDQQLALLEVDYKKRQRYERAQTPLFKTYKCVILGLYLVAMIKEFKGIWLYLSWCIQFPSIADLDENSGSDVAGKEAVEKEVDDDGNAHYTIHAATGAHRSAVTFVTLVRMAMLAVLMVVGVIFLNKQTGYVGLLLDGIAMLFIIEIAEILFGQVLRKAVQDQVSENVNEMTFNALEPGIVARRPALRSLLWALLIIGITIGITYWDSVSVSNPLYHSLTCTCIGEGEKCYEADRFSYDFWWDYWKNVVPASIKKIKAMEAASAASAASSSAASLLSRARHHTLSAF